ncbi:MAG: DUF2341 domain-containing protein [Candidatus Hodarchaeota archaeon]
MDSDLHDHVNQSNGNDIAFANDTAWLDHEIELFDQSYNITHAQLIAWVRIPELLISRDTIIRMYYGNSTMQSQENPQGVWDSNYKGVWHLSEDPSDSPPQMKDSTSNNNHGTTSNLDPSDQINGQIDGSIDFDGGTDYDLIDCGNDTSLNMGSSEFSLSTWFNYDGVDWGAIAGKGAVLQGKRYYLSFNTPAGQIRAEIDDDSTSVNPNIVSGANYGDNKWHHLVMVRDEDYLRLYLDGNEDGTRLVTSYGNIDSIHPFYMNAICGDNGGQITSWSSVKLDEVRVSNTARSAYWIATEFNNQNDPSSFYSIGNEYNVIHHPVNANYFRFYKEIIINHIMVSGSTDLLNFSVLISVLDSDLYDDVQSTGNDIAFAKDTAWLDHEIELFDQNYNETHAHLVAWIRIPSLSTSTDTKIYMYYGNSTMGSQQNPVGVWDSNYYSVYHMNQDPSNSSVLDSTANNYDLNAGSGFTSGDFIDGIIGKAIKFNSQPDEYLNISSGFSNPTSCFSLELWFKPQRLNSFQRYFTAVSENYPEDIVFNYNTTNNFLRTNIKNSLGNRTLIQSYFNGWDLNQFYHFVCTWEGGSVGRVIHYLNGAIDRNVTDANALGTASAWSGFFIGTDIDYSDSSDVIIEEFRITSSVRSSDWFQTEYNNQYNPQAFMTLGQEEKLEMFDDTPPTYSDLIESADPLRVGQNETISIKVYDFSGSGVNQVLLEYDSSNHSMVFIGEDTWSWSKWKPSIGIHLYKIFMEDMENNWNMTSGTITVVEATAPIIENVTKSEDPLELGNNTTISVDVFDEQSNVSTVFIEVAGENHTMVNIGGNTYEYNWTSSYVGIFYYTIYANDSVNNWGFINDSILVQDTTLPIYFNLDESADPLELGDSLIISIDIYDFAGINQTFIEIEGVNFSMTNFGGDTWQYSSWTPNNWIVYQYKIHMEDKSGNWNSLTANITVQDTTPPSKPSFANSPSGDVSGILVFDWYPGFDESGISYYILIIDNETNPSTTPGYVYIFNTTNTYCELPEILPPGKYYFFLAQVDGVGQQGNYTIGTFTVITSENGPPGDNTFLIIVIIFASVIGSATAIVLVRRKLKKDIAPPHEKIPFKVIISHINKLSSAHFALKAEEIQGITDEQEIEMRLNGIKSLGEELFAEGAYLEAQEQFKLGRDLLISLGREEEANLFSELIDGIDGLIEEREKRLEILEQAKIERNAVQIFKIHQDLINISKKLRDLDGTSFYQAELINYFQNNNWILVDLEKYRSEMEEEAESLYNNSYFENAAQLYEKCEIVSQLFVQLGREKEIAKIEEFRYKKEECLKKN